MRAAIATGEAAVRSGATRGLPWRVSGAVVSLAVMTGDPRSAAPIYAGIGSRPDEAYARLHAARQLAPGHPDEAGAELAGALEFFHQVRASAYLAEAEELAR